jgi:hypothetical protein
MCPNLPANESQAPEAFLVLDPDDVRVAGDEERDALVADARLRHVENGEPGAPVDGDLAPARLLGSNKEILYALFTRFLRTFYALFTRFLRPFYALFTPFLRAFYALNSSFYAFYLVLH